MTITINEKEYHLPLSWGEVTLEQYVRLYEVAKTEAGFTGLLAALLGLTEHELNNAPASAVNPELAIKLSWLVDSPPQIENKPSYLVLEERIFAIPENFNELLYGQILALQLLIAANSNGETINPACFAKVLAIVLCTNTDGEYTDKKADKLEPHCARLPFIQAMPLVNFFLSSLPVSASANGSNSSTRPATKKSGRVCRALKSLARTRLFAWLWKPNA